MRLKIALIATALCAVFATIAGTAGAAPARWVPGTGALVTESDMTDLLEMRFDSAYCEGVARFGHSGEFPYEKFIVFDCSIERRDADIDCDGTRIKAVKARTVGKFIVKLIDEGTCY